MKRIILAGMILLLCITSSSCTKRMSDEEIMQNLGETAVPSETLTDVGIPEDSDAVPETVPESEYPTGVEGIISPDHWISDGKYYFVTRRDRINMITYIDLETREDYIICPDPLCEHEENGDCKYAGFGSFYPSETPGVFYSAKKSTLESKICRIDLNKDTVTTVYTTRSINMSVRGMDHEKLYFSVSEAKMDEEKEIKTLIHYYYIDTRTDEIVDVGYMPEEFSVECGAIFLIRDGYIYYHTKSGEVRKTDFSYSESEYICDTGDYGVCNWIYDTKTEELFIQLRHREQRKGEVWRYRDGKGEKIEFPHGDTIFLFTLTNSKMYYSVYDEGAVSFGKSRAPGNPEVYDLAGGKVYAVDREQPGDAELVYDRPGEYLLESPFGSYCVIDNCLYFDEPDFVRENIDGVEYVYFDYAYTINRIKANLETGEITRLRFE